MALSAESKLTIKVAAEDLTAPGFQGAESKMGKLKGAASGLVGVLAGAGASSVVGALSDAARAAAEDEASTLRLSQAIENTGTSFDSVAGAIDEHIRAGQQLAFSDSDVRESIGQLATALGDSEKAMQLQATAMDVARGKGIDLGAATDLVQKAALGQVGALKKVGIVLDEGATATEALAALQQKFGGQAEKYGSTTEAAIFRVKDSIGEWTESLGQALGPAQGIVGVLPGLSSGMSIAGGAIGGLSTIIRGAAIPSLIAMAAPFAPLLLAVAGIGAAVALLVVAWNNNWGDIQGKVQAVIGFVTGIFEVFQTEGLGGLLRRIVEFAQTVPAMFLEMGKGIVSGLLEGLGGLKDAIWNALRNAFESIDFRVGPFRISGRHGISIDMPSIPGFASGGVMPHTGLAMLHAGERVLTPEQQASGGWGGNVNITVNANGNIGLDEDELAQKILQSINRSVNLSRGGMGRPYAWYPR
jgi:hypothetical protein